MLHVALGKRLSKPVGGESWSGGVGQLTLVQSIGGNISQKEKPDARDSGRHQFLSADKAYDRRQVVLLQTTVGLIQTEKDRLAQIGGGHLNLVLEFAVNWEIITSLAGRSITLTGHRR